MIIKYFLIVLFFSLQACGLTTKDLVSNSDKTKNTKIFAVSQQGIVVSEDNGLKWEQLLTADKYQGQVLDLVKQGEDWQLITTAGSYLYENKSLTNNFSQPISSTTFVNGKRYFIANNFLYEKNISTANQIVSANFSNILAFNNQLLAVSGNKLLLLNQKNQWQLFFDFPEIIQEIISNPHQLLVIAGQEVFKITKNKQLLKIAATELKSKVKTISSQGYLYLADNDNLLKRTFSGEVWDEFTPETGYLPTKVRDIKVKDLAIYLAGDNGITYSLNGGQTWHRFNKSHGLPTDKITKIFID